MHVLIVEDEAKLSAYLKRGLEEEGYAVDLAHNGHDALAWARTMHFDMIVLDIMLPGMDGLAVCQALRERDIRTPILMLTARDTVDDRVVGLDAGADDYLVKPFAFKELLARLRALGRRSTEQEKSTVLTVGELSLDTATHQVTRDGQLINLAAKEYAVLECLMREKNRVLTRDAIADHVWDYSTFNESNVIDVYIRNLRRKVDDPFDTKLIQTVRGVGYRISEDAPLE
ncbi:MAG: response regulator transcription factor [Chloroflexi bacterium]|nr:response regulator transcription factor [Chloroflexota bacterium]